MGVAAVGVSSAATCTVLSHDGSGISQSANALSRAEPGTGRPARGHRMIAR